jgi:hypothetical protein
MSDEWPAARRGAQSGLKLWGGARGGEIFPFEEWDI